MPTEPHPRSQLRASRIVLAAGAALVATLAALAGGTGENALLLVDPTRSESLWAANYYRAARQIPARNVLYVDPGAVSYQAFVSTNIAGLFGFLAERGIADHIDYLVVMPGTNFFVSAPGLVSDGCAPVTRFGIAGAYTTAFITNVVLGGVSSQRTNRYYRSNNDVYGFDSEISWLSGMPTASGGERYFISAMLGYTGALGNTMPEVLAMIDRSVAVDGIFPVGTTYFMHTTDPLRSGPRDPYYPSVAAAIIAAGGNAQVLFDVLPLTHHDCLGVMTGWADPDIDGADMTLLPGCFADHLTSFAGNFSSSSQTKMSRWIAKGASGTCGAVEEPCNYAGKFPHARMHLFYRKGLSLGEAWFRSMQYVPFQNLLLGDPLTRPFTWLPVVDVPDLPKTAASGTISIHPLATAMAPGAAIERLEVLVDGVTVRSGLPGQGIPLDTGHLGDGWHEVRVLAYDDTDVRAVGRWIGWMEVDNGGRIASAVPAITSGDQGTRFDFAVSAQGSALTELRLVQSGRVLATSSASPDTLSVFGVTLGPGPAEVQAEALYADGEQVRSLPIQLDVSASGSGSGTLAPFAHDYHRKVLTGGSCIVELPAVFDDTLDSAAFTLVTPPSQAIIAAGNAGGYRMITPDPGATGTDTLVWRVTTPSGNSADATVYIEYVDPPAPCTTPVVYCSAKPNSTGGPAAIGSAGTASVIGNDFYLEVFGAPPNRLGLFYYGPDQVQVPLGDGYRCVGGASFRLTPPILIDAFGIASRKLDFNEGPPASGASAIRPGSTWNFQFWYRDPAGPGGTGYNLSDGLSVKFCP